MSENNGINLKNYEVQEGNQLNKEEKPIYEVDEAMLGSDWRHEWDLSIFVDELQKLVPEIEIKEIYDSYNGANNDQEVQDLITAEIWLKALDNFCDKHD